MDTVKKGDKVSIHYVGLLEDKTIFDRSEKDDPLQFEAGTDEILAGISNGVIGMAVGEKKTITLSPEQAYGNRIAGLEQAVPLSDLPNGVQVGDLLSGEIQGEQIILSVVEINGDTATLDANHPLAGHTLTFDIELVGLEPA